MLGNISKPLLLGCGAITALTLTSYTLTQHRRHEHPEWAAAAAQDLTPLKGPSPPLAPRYPSLPSPNGPATERKTPSFVDGHAATLQTTRALLTEVKKAHEEYKANLKELMDEADLKAWSGVEKKARTAMRAVHRFACENLTMWETVIQRLQDDEKDTMYWDEAMEGYSIEERVSWLQIVHRKMDDCLSSHRVFRQRLIRRYENKLSRADAALRKKWHRVLSAGGMAVASMAALAALYSYQAPEGSKRETAKSYLLTTVATELAAQLVSGAKLAWDYCAGLDASELGGQRDALEQCKEQLSRNEQDMAKASAHLLAADIRYEQLCCRSRPGQDQPGMRLGRRDLVPALRRLLDQELRPLIQLCSQYSIL